MLTDIEAVIFDLDGTLIDSMWVWKDIDEVYLKSIGERHDEARIAQVRMEIEGKSFKEVAEIFKREYGISDSISRIMQTWTDMAYDRYKNVVKLKPHVKEFLDYIKERGIKIGLATSNSEHLAATVLKSRGIFDYFSAMITGDEGKGKPHPGVYLRAAKKLGVRPDKCLVFEDLTAGLMSASNAGMKTCAVRDPYSEYQLDEKIRLADYCINDFNEVIGVI